MMKYKIFILSLIVSTLVACTNHFEIAQAKLNQPQQQAIVEEQQHQNKPVVALVLGSGGVRGYAHIGVLQVLEQHGIKPDFIVGTSAGSLVGVLYSGQQSAQKVYNIVQQLKVGDIREFDINLKSVFAGNKIAQFINKNINYQKLEDLKTPVYVVATRLDNGEQAIFNYGDSGQAVQASIAIPSMFQPVKIGNYEYVDGGLVNPVPVMLAKQLGADVVIAVNILAKPSYTKTTNMWGLFNQNINIMQNKMVEEEMKYADVIIQPDIREKGHLFDIKSRNHLIQAGTIASQEKIEQIKQRIEEKTQEMQDQKE